MLVAVHLEDDHVLVADPGITALGIGELSRLDRQRRAIAQRLQRLHGPAQVIGLQLHHQVEIERDAAVAVCGDRQSADDQVAGPGIAQGDGNRLQARQLHGDSRVDRSMT